MINIQQMHTSKNSNKNIKLNHGVLVELKYIIVR